MRNVTTEQVACAIGAMKKCAESHAGEYEHIYLANVHGWITADTVEHALDKFLDEHDSVPTIMSLPAENEYDISLFTPDCKLACPPLVIDWENSHGN